MSLKLLTCAASLALTCAVGLNAQTESKTKTKVEIKGGKEITTTGCVDRLNDGRYALTSIGGETQYVLVGKDDVGKEVGHRVQVRGHATDLGDAKVKTETTTETKSDHKNGTEQESRTTTERKGPLAARLLSVDSLKVLARSCQ